MRTARTIVRLGVVAAVGMVTSASARQAPQSATTQARPLCTLPDRGTYSPGAVIHYDGQLYRCLYAYGEELKPVGVVWIKMQQTLTPREPSAR